MTRNLKRICADIEHPPHPLDHLQKAFMARQLYFDPQPRFRVVRSDFDLARFVINLDCAPVAVGLDDLNAWGGPRP